VFTFPQAYLGLGQVYAADCGEPRFPGLGQAKARPKSVYTVKMLAKVKARPRLVV
jgi:hypothetical protein